MMGEVTSLREPAEELPALLQASLNPLLGKLHADLCEGVGEDVLSLLDVFPVEFNIKFTGSFCTVHVNWLT